VEHIGVRLAQALGEHPRQQLRFAVGFVPGEVAQAEILEILRLSAGVAQRLDHVPRALHLHHGVIVGVEGPHGHLRNGGRDCLLVATAAHRRRRGEAFWEARETVPRGVTAHREAGDAEAAGIDAEFFEDRVEGFTRQLHRGTGLFGPHAGVGVPGHIDPLLVVGALRRQDEARELGAMLRLGEQTRAVLELRGVVRATFARAVEESTSGYWVPASQSLG